MKRNNLPPSHTILAAMAVILAAVGSPVSAVEMGAKEIQALEWRNIGPFSGGRGT